MDTTDPLAWVPWMLQSADALFPTGAYAHSLGLEQCVQLGLVRDAAELGRHLAERTLPALREFELPYLRFAYEAAAAGNIGLLAELDEEIGAAKLARETRGASEQLGRRRLGALRTIFPENALLAACAEHTMDWHQITVCAMQATAAGAPLMAALPAYYYQTVAAVGAAALKLIRIGQDSVQRALAECNRAAGQAVFASLGVGRNDAGWFDPLLEIASMRHERTGERLFIS